MTRLDWRMRIGMGMGMRMRGPARQRPPRCPAKSSALTASRPPPPRASRHRSAPDPSCAHADKGTTRMEGKTGALVRAQGRRRGRRRREMTVRGARVVLALLEPARRLNAAVSHPLRSFNMGVYIVPGAIASPEREGRRARQASRRVAATIHRKVCVMRRPRRFPVRTSSHPAVSIASRSP